MKGKGTDESLSSPNSHLRRSSADLPWRSGCRAQGTARDRRRRRRRARRTNKGRRGRLSQRERAMSMTVDDGVLVVVPVVVCDDAIVRRTLVLIAFIVTFVFVVAILRRILMYWRFCVYIMCIVVVLVVTSSLVSDVLSFVLTTHSYFQVFFLML